MGSSGVAPGGVRAGRLTGLWSAEGYPATVEGGPDETPRKLPADYPSIPRWSVPAGVPLHARDAGSAETECPPAAAPAQCGPDGRPLSAPRDAEKEGGRGIVADGAGGGLDRPPRRNGHPRD